MVTGPGRPLGRTVSLPVEVDCEDGVTRQVDTDRLPADFPLGYHRFRGAGRGLAPADRVARPVLAAARAGGPGGSRCSCTPPGRRSSWGIGDLADLRAVRDVGRSSWAPASCMVNPLHAVAPTLPQEASPYLPATRRWRNPLYLRVDEVPGADAVDLAGPTAAGRGADRAAADRPGRRLAAQAPGARAGLRRTADAAPDGFDGWRAEQGSVAAGPRDLVRARRHARTRLARLARGAATTRTARP